MGGRGLFYFETKRTKVTSFMCRTSCISHEPHAKQNAGPFEKNFQAATAERYTKHRALRSMLVEVALEAGSS